MIIMFTSGLSCLNTVVIRVKPGVLRGLLFWLAGMFAVEWIGEWVEEGPEVITGAV